MWLHRRCKERIFHSTEVICRHEALQHMNKCIIFHMKKKTNRHINKMTIQYGRYTLICSISIIQIILWLVAVVECMNFVSVLLFCCQLFLNEACIISNISLHLHRMNMKLYRFRYSTQKKTPKSFDEKNSSINAMAHESGVQYYSKFKYNSQFSSFLQMRGHDVINNDGWRLS